MRFKDLRYENMRHEASRILSILFLISQISLSQILSGQSKVIDSLKLELKNAKHDTTRCNILTAMIEAEPDDAELNKYNNELKKLTEQKLSEGPRIMLAKIYKAHLATALGNSGYLCNRKGQIKEALGYYTRSLKLQEEIGDKKGIAVTINNIGFIYYNQKQIKEALDYFSKSLKLQEETGDKRGMAASLNNIGSMYYKQGQANEALAYFFRAITIQEEIGDKRGIANSLNNIGSIYNNQGKMKEGLDYFSRSLKIQEEFGNKKQIATCLNNMGRIYLKMNDISKALDFGLRTFSLSKEIGYPENIGLSAQLLSEIYEKLNNGPRALEMYKLYIQMRDSVTNAENKKATIQKQIQYEYEKKAAADSVAFAKAQEIKNVQIEKQHAELKSKRTQQYFLFGGLGLVLVFAGFMHNRFRVTQKQKSIIEKQKLIVEEQKMIVELKQKEVLDSIIYAKRIQTALLTSEKYIERNLSSQKNR